MPVKRHLIDRVVAAVLAAAVIVLLSIWPFAGLHPHVWEETAIAAGLVPQGAMLPGLGVYLSHLLFKALPYETALSLVGLCAKLAVGVCVFLAYGVFARMLELTTVFGGRDLRRRALATRLAAAVGAVALGCSDPFWRAAQGVSGSLTIVLLVLFASWCYTRFLSCAETKSLVFALAALGVLSAESPLGWVLLGLFVFLTPRYLALAKNELWSTVLDPIRVQRTKWSVTFLFLGAYLSTMLVECLAFASLDGLKAFGVTFESLPLVYAKAYFGQFAEGASLLGFVGLIAAAVLPFLLTFTMARVATDEELFLPFKLSIVYFCCGLVAYLQLASVPLAWFWRIVDGASVSMPFQLFGVTLAAGAVVWALFVLLVEVLSRDYAHIESQMYLGGRAEDDEDDAPEGRASRPAADGVTSIRLGWGRCALLLVPVALVALVAWGRRLPHDRQLQQILCTYANEVLDEVDDLTYLVTDGAFDSYLRLEARRRGRTVRFLSAIGGDSPRDAYIRQQGTDGLEDRLSLQTGAAEALRTWIVSKSPRLDETAVQLAFELFRINRRLSPTIYGTLVRPVGGSADSAAVSVARCHALADRIVDLHDRGVWRHATDALLKDRFLFVQFRLAVISRLRALHLDPQMKTRESIEEIAYSDRLNERNPSLRSILRHLDWVRRQRGDDLTPREGLEVAMKRADFVMARRYAMPVLHQDPDEPTANFALGMSYYAEQQFAKAEEYLKRALKRMPDEPAVYNNLALLYLKTDRLDEARAAAAKAIELKPELAEILDTVRQIEDAQQEKGKTK